MSQNYDDFNIAQLESSYKTWFTVSVVSVAIVTVNLESFVFPTNHDLVRSSHAFIVSLLIIFTP